MIIYIHQIAMAQEHFSIFQNEPGPVLIHVHAEKIGEVRFHEKIVVALTEMNGDALSLEARQYADDIPESRIDFPPATEPEIEKIPGNEKMIGKGERGRGRSRSHRIRSLQAGKKFLHNLIVCLMGVP